VALTAIPVLSLFLAVNYEKVKDQMLQFQLDYASYKIALQATSNQFYQQLQVVRPNHDQVAIGYFSMQIRLSAKKNSDSQINIIITKPCIDHFSPQQRKCSVARSLFEVANYLWVPIASLSTMKFNSFVLPINVS
jgi:hypothetical protein